MNIDAMYLKKPASSSAIDIKDIEINNINIFNGLISLFDIKLWKNWFLSKPGNNINNIAANKSGIKNVSNVIFLILKIGNFKIHKNIKIMALIEIIKVYTILTPQKIIYLWYKTSSFFNSMNWDF